MKNKISYTNQKGQIVIPKELRDELNIDDSVGLQIRRVGDSIMISPVTGYVAQSEKELVFKEILDMTRGKWGPETEDEKRLAKKRRRLELAASARRKKGW